MILSAILVILTFLTPKIDSAERVISAPIHFRWDGSEHDRDYFENGAATDSLVNALYSIGPENITDISITGYSSPDGSREHNMKLSRRRAAEVGRIIAGSIPELSGKIHTRGAGEAWGLLRERVEGDMSLSVPTCDRILNILDDKGISDDTRKWRLAHRLGHSPENGDVYRHLLRKHYRYLRCAIVEIHVSVPEKESEVQPEPAEPAETQASPAPPAHSVPSEGPAAFVPDLRPARIPVLGISTNLLYDCTYVPGYGLTSIPSFSLEYYPRAGFFTFGADVEWPMWQHWDRHDFFQINNITLWGRRYFRPKFGGFFQGAYSFASVNVFRYGIGYDDKGWQGEGAGVSAGIGYRHMIGRSRFFFDTGIALGTFWSKYDPYVWGDDATHWYYYDYSGTPEDFKERSKRFLWLGPTRVYFSIGYDLIRRKK